MIPFIDVVFLVLVAFIYASMFMTYKTGLPIDLPEASETEAEKSEVLTLVIMRDGSLLLDDVPVTLEDLEDRLGTAKTSSDEELVLYVMADREARLDPLVKVMNLARRVGITGLTIAANRDLTPAAGDATTSSDNLMPSAGEITPSVGDLMLAPAE